MPEVINLHDINEMLKLLKGEYPVRHIRRSQYDPPEFDVPTEIYVVLNEYVYQDASCKPVFQEALTVLFSGIAVFQFSRNLLKVYDSITVFYSSSH